MEPAQRLEGEVKMQPEASPPRNSPQPAGVDAAMIREPDTHPVDTSTKATTGDVWWSCQRCSFTIPTGLDVAKRNGRKCFHILGHGHSMKARSGNYFHRSRMLRAVWSGKLKKTPGGLTKEDLKINAKGRVRHAISEDRLRNRCLEQRFRYEALTCSAKKGICTVSTLSVYTVPVAALAACWFCLLPLTVCLPCWLLSGFCCSNLPLTCSYVDLLAVYFY